MCFALFKVIGYQFVPPYPYHPAVYSMKLFLVHKSKPWLEVIIERILTSGIRLPIFEIWP